jgi:hypothetical protein
MSRILDKATHRVEALFREEDYIFQSSASAEAATDESAP